MSWEYPPDKSMRMRWFKKGKRRGCSGPWNGTFSLFFEHSDDRFDQTGFGPLERYYSEDGVLYLK